MRRLLGALSITFVALTYASASAQARVTADDAAATHAYLETTIAMHRELAAEESAELNEIAAFGTQIEAECPNVLSGAPPQVKGEPPSESDAQIGQEVVFATFGAVEHVEHPALARYATAVRRLRWSNRRLTKLLRSLAREQAVQSAIPPPKLCSDLTFWVASGYTAVSPGTKEFLHHLAVVSSIAVIEPEPHEPVKDLVKDLLNPEGLVAYRLERYESRADRRLANEALQSETMAAELVLKPMLEAVDHVYTVIGRPAPPVL